MNWGWKVTILYALFVVGMLTLVFKATSERVDLVAPDYYAQELAYGKRLEAQRNARAMNKVPLAKQESKSLIIEIPESCNQLSNGIAHVYCPANATLDKFLTLTGQATQFFLLEEQPTGMYLIKISFELEGQPYFIEQALEWK